jgi:cobalt/nickel transport system permease protein
VKGEGFLTTNISGFTRVLESVIVNEDMSRASGLLQGLDPRVKILTFMLFIVTAGLARSFTILLALFTMILVLTILSKVPMGFFLKRVLLFVPVFTAVIAIPALFITPGEPLLRLAGGIIITAQGARTAGLLALRVVNSLSFGVLLVLTTPWTGILVALRALRMPSLLVDILGMTYRYIFLLLLTANAMFLSRRSRTIGGFSGQDNRRWLARALTTIMVRSEYLSEEVYLAMCSRGYRGEARTLDSLKMRGRDLLWAVFAVAAVSILLWCNYL